MVPALAIRAARILDNVKVMDPMKVVVGQAISKPLGKMAALVRGKVIAWGTFGASH